MTTLKQAALYYAAKGWPVIPLHYPHNGKCSCGAPNCPSPAKHPIGRLVPNGVKNASTNPEIIEAWWNAFPRANIGLATGNGRIVLDIDRRRGGDDTLLAFDLPEAPTQLTGGGGEHRVFSCAVAVQNSQNVLGPGLDVRGDGGYIVAAPSVHISGRVYQWEVDHALDELTPPPLPDDILSILTSGNGEVKHGERKGVLPDELREGERNDRLYRHACNLRRVGLSDEEILTVLRVENERRCVPPLHENELLTITRSACRHEPSDPLRMQAVPVEFISAKQADDNTDIPFDLTLTDAGNAKGLAAHWGDVVRYVHDYKTWLIWNGMVWAEDTQNGMIRFAEQYARAVYIAAIDLPNAEQRRKQSSHGQRSMSRQRLEAAIDLLRAEQGISIRQSQLDNHHHMINCPNGVLDLKTGRLDKHDPSLLMTKITNTEYHPEATCPRWEQFISEIMLGREELITYLQRALGYALTGDTSEQVLFLLYGVGANGKSTLLDVVRRVLGDYARVASFDTFLAQRQTGSPRDDLAYLTGARFVSSNEPRAEGRLDESVIKQLTGGEAISCRRLYGPYFEYVPRYKLFLACNQKPYIRGTDHGIWRRVKLIPFELVVSEERQHKHLTDELLDEREGILAWLVKGTMEWQFSGLLTPNKVNEATAEYREDQDPFADFLRECCDEGAGYSVSATELYKAYRQFCERNSITPLSQTALGRYLTERGYKVTRGRDDRKRRQGIALKSELDLTN